MVQHTISKGLDQLASAQVPHSWFKHFYILSMLLSAFWAAQFLSQGTVYRWFVVQANTNGTPAGNMSLEQILLAWGLMSMHACRRLYECIAFAKSSSSRMWIAHWLLGLTFYTAASMAIWVEGIRKWSHLLQLWNFANVYDELAALRTSEISWKAFPLGPPSARTLLCIPLFLLSSGLQFICHYHLSSLKKYSLPTHPAFQILICPHYTAECLIYLSLAVMAAPRGSLINVTLLTTLILVLVNLGITSDMTREFYIRKFKDDTIRNRWRMIPLLF